MRTYLKLILSVIVLIVGCKPKQNIKTLKLGHGLDVSHPVHKGIVFFAEDLNKRSNGSLTIKIYPNG
ncbi:MAG: TRAP transporter substrate-binding protein, partial [Flavobacteriales bacterium]|nr:TRAP transporter substrate-binding protein [Flavobacteriales bacterium]